MYRYALFGLYWLCLLPLLGHAQSIPPQRRTDWTHPGAKEMFVPQHTVQLTDFGADPTGAIPADSALRQALEALPGSGLILLPAGTYRFTSTIQLPDSIILRGEPAADTYEPLTTLLLEAEEQHGISITGGMTEIGPIQRGECQQGQRFIDLRPDHPFQDGDLLWIRPVDDGPLVYSDWAHQSTGQLVRISDATPTRLWLEKPLRRTFIPNNITLVEIHPRRQVHVQCLRIERQKATEAQTANIFFDLALDCSVSGIESHKGNFSHVTIQRSAHITVENSLFREAHSYGNGGRGYGVMLQFSASDCFVHQNNFETLRHAMILQAGANGNVIAYNHSLHPIWTDVALPEDSAGDLVLHGNYVYQNLLEGNVVQNIVVDASHGYNGPNNTFFRNRAEGYGLFVFEGASRGGQNLIGNQVTNTSSIIHGQFFLAPDNHLAWNNWIRTRMDTPDATDIPEASLFGYVFGSYYHHVSTTPPIQHHRLETSMPPLEAQYRMSQHQPATCFPLDYSSIVTTQAPSPFPFSEVHIYPNPFTDLLRIDGLQPGTPVGLFDLQGRLLYQTKASHQEEWHLPPLPPGLYVLRAVGRAFPIVKRP